MDLLNIIEGRINADKKSPASFIKDHAPTLARQRTLHLAMSAMRETAFDRIAANCPEGIVATQEILDAEIVVARLQGFVMTGKIKLEDYRAELESWEATVNHAIYKAYPEKE